MYHLLMSSTCFERDFSKPGISLKSENPCLGNMTGQFTSPAHHLQSPTHLILISLIRTSLFPPPEPVFTLLSELTNYLISLPGDLIIGQINNRDNENDLF